MEQLNLKILEPIPHKQMLALINQYIYSSTDEINKMAFHAEQELMKIDEHLEYIENKVLLLQSKLASQAGTGPQQPQQPQQDDQQQQQQQHQQ